MNTSTAMNQSGGVAARLERLPLTGYQKMLFAIIATAWLFDSMDLGACLLYTSPSPRD